MFPIARLARHQNKPESALNDVLPRATKRERERERERQRQRQRHRQRQTQTQTDRQTERERKRWGGGSCTDASTCERGPCNDPDTLSILRNQLETLMGLVPIVTEQKSAYDANSQ